MTEYIKRHSSDLGRPFISAHPDTVKNIRKNGRYKLADALNAFLKEGFEIKHDELYLI